ncbi:trypsin-like serine peptidase [Streptomyces gobiensis]|uniref:trypsin-like serine peptidase n=1 Tax=Streptomyces gobiensis TaxID=2875706 RepID=UPI001E2B56C7|nr:peptidase [Streptomyces gobiensis]UGY93247.1 peptidase [Streptomyces gobiensis]
MKRNPRSALGSLIVVGALLTAGALASPAGAAPASPADPSADSISARSAAISATAQERVSGHWTAERMRKATPLDQLSVSRADVPALSAAVPSGARATIDPISPKKSVGSQAFPESGGPWTSGGDVVATAGRVFFTYNGRSASCSGNAVTSDNASTVITAGHCVKLNGNWHTDWVFVPGYHDGQAPHGKWTAAKTLATSQWVASEDINYDVGAAVVNPLDGKRLTDVVGGQGLAFNTGYNKDMYAFGFPAAAPYDGEKFIYCGGRTSRDFLLTRSHGMTCDMTGGSSGGPWFTAFDEATGKGLQSSVNSFKYNFRPNTMYGPYFGDDAQKLYQEAQSS